MVSRKQPDKPKPVICPNPECRGRRARPIKGTEKDDGTVQYLCYSCHRQWREQDHRVTK